MPDDDAIGSTPSPTPRRKLLLVILFAGGSLLTSWLAGVPWFISYPWALTCGAVGALPFLASHLRVRWSGPLEPRYQRSLLRFGYPVLFVCGIVALAAWHWIAWRPWLDCRHARYELLSQPTSYDAVISEVEGFEKLALGERCRIEIEPVEGWLLATEARPRRPSPGQPPDSEAWSCAPTAYVTFECPKRTLSFQPHAFEAHADELGFSVGGHYDDGSAMPPTVLVAPPRAHVIAWATMGHLRSQVVWRIEGR